jgi:peroxiredoxin Q/BCP
MLEINKKIEYFELDGIDENGKERVFALDAALNKGKSIVLYFYPKDDTPGCTQEACDFRDNFNRLTGKAVVVGISPDDIKKHKKFQEKHNLNFSLLSDVEHKILERFGAWGEKSMYGKKYMGVTRSTFLIDQEGILRKIWSNVKVKGHVEEVLNELVSI